MKGLREDAGSRLLGGDAAFAHEVGQPLVVNTYSHSEVLEDEPLTRVLNKHIVCASPGLFSGSSPTAVARLVTLIGVFSVEGGAFGSGPHVCEKGREVVHPFATHGDSATAVALVLGVSRAEAPGLGAVPRTEFWSFLAAATVSVGHGVRTSSLTLIAAATGDAPFPDAHQANLFLHATVAAEQPAGMAALGCNLTHRHQTAIALPCNIQRRVHKATTHDLLKVTV